MAPSSSTFSSAGSGSSTSESSSAVPSGVSGPGAMRMPLASGSSVWALSWRIASEAMGVRVSIMLRYPRRTS